MKWAPRLYLVLVFSSFAPLWGQGDTSCLNVQLKEVPFAAFASIVEEQCGVTLYYRHSWTENIMVTISGKSAPLLHVLDSIFDANGLRYFQDDWNHVFVTDTVQLTDGLPEYTIVSEPTLIQADTSLLSETTTNAELNYIRGRRVRDPVVLHVGSTPPEPGKNVLVNGRIDNAESGEPLIGATLYIEALKKGTSSNSDGLFSLVIPAGTFQVECNSLGMKPLQFTLVVQGSGDLLLSMAPTLIPLEEVVVRSARHHNVSGLQMGYEHLSSGILKEVPLVMGERDIINVVKLLPGVQSVGEGSAGFNVRGSGADQNLVYINKVPVYNSSHLFGFFTSFSPEIVSDFTLIKSSLPANYGGRLSSFFDIQARQGNMKHFAARGGISSVSSNISVEGPIRKDKSSLLFSGRTTYSDWILRRMEDPLLRRSEAGFNDLSGVYTLKGDDNNQITLFAYRSSDRFRLSDIHHYEYATSGTSLQLRHRFSHRLTGNMALVYGKYNFTNSNTEQVSGGYQHSFQIHHNEIRSDFHWRSLGSHHVTFGSSAILYHLNRGVIEGFGRGSIRETLDLGRENGMEFALYAADEITLTPALSVYAGLRISTFLYLGPAQVRLYDPGMPRLDEFTYDTLSFDPFATIRTYLGPEPRINLRYLLGDYSSVKVSYNRTYQYLFMLSNTVAIAPSDQWKLCDYHTEPQYLDQFSIGYYREFQRSGLSTSLEAYGKRGSRIVEYRDGANFQESRYVESVILQGSQRGYGGEVMIRKGTGALTGWISYSYTRSFMHFNDPQGNELINNGEPYPSNFDRPHGANLVVNFKRGRRLSISANLVYLSGRPVTYPVSVYYEYEIPYIHYSERNQYRIPDYFRVDLSMNMEGNLKRKKPFHSYWMLGVYNLTGRKNAYSVFFKNVGGNIRGYKLSIFGQPILTLSWNIKLGNYASE